MMDEAKLQLVTYRINRAKETLSEVEFQIENQKWNTAVNRLYYACYYAVIALLIRNDINTKTHAGVRQMFGLHFIKTGRIDIELGDFYTDIFEMRHTGDYDDFIVFEAETVIALLPAATKLIHRIEAILFTE
jgi:uncharacterized protein (UPF0332 family)